MFRNIDPDAPLIVAEAVWQFSHHVLAGLMSHRGPILTVANWSGQWPGLVGMLNLNGSLTKAGVTYSTLWGESFADESFLAKLQQWLNTGKMNMILRMCIHLIRMPVIQKPGRSVLKLLKRCATTRRFWACLMKAVWECSMRSSPTLCSIRSGSSKNVSVSRRCTSELSRWNTAKHKQVRDWLNERGMRFHTGPDHDTDLTDAQILDQCRMYIAAMRIADDFGCDAIGIQYQQGLNDLLPASDLVEGMLNDSIRPPV